MKGFTPVPESRTVESSDAWMLKVRAFGTGFQPPLNRKNRCSYRGGFTLIELMVVSTILLLSIGTVAKYNDYHDKKQLSTTVDTVLTNLRLAQTLAIQGKKPISGCTTFNGYIVKFNSATTYYSAARCSAEENEVYYQLPSQIQFTSPTPVSILFLPLSGAVSTSQTIALTRNGVTKNINVSTSGLLDTQ